MDRRKHIGIVVFLVCFCGMALAAAGVGGVFLWNRQGRAEARMIEKGKRLCRLLAPAALEALRGRAAGEGKGKEKGKNALAAAAGFDGVNRVRLLSPEGRTILHYGRADEGKNSPVTLPLGIEEARSPVYSGSGRGMRFWFPVRDTSGRVLAFLDLELGPGPGISRDLAGGAVLVFLLVLLLAFAASRLVLRLAAAPFARLLPAAAEEEGGRRAGGYGAVLGRTAGLLAEMDERIASLARKAEESGKALAEARIQMRQAMHELKETQAQVIQAEKMAGLGLLVSGVAHEINNTMNIVSGALPPLAMQVEKLRRHPDEEEKERALSNMETLMGNIREGAARTSEIIRTLQDFARTRPMEYKEADPCRILDTTLFLLKPRMKDIEVTREYDSSGATLPCYPGRLGQVFMNIIINSVQAMEGRGRLLVRTWTGEGRFHVLIADDGPGIPPEIRGRVFDPFFTTKEIGQGTGLGLSVCYSMIKAHRGGIEIVPSPFGRGCGFRISLPLA